MKSTKACSAHTMYSVQFDEDPIASSLTVWMRHHLSFQWCNETLSLFRDRTCAATEKIIDSQTPSITSVFVFNSIGWKPWVSTTLTIYFLRSRRVEHVLYPEYMSIKSQISILFLSFVSTTVVRRLSLFASASNNPSTSSSFLEILSGVLGF